MPVTKTKATCTVYSCVLIFLLACSSCASAGQINQLSQEEKKQGFKLLFDGKSMEQWRNYKSKTTRPQWQIIDETMVLTAKGGRDLITKEKFGYFDLRLEYTIAEKGNSGIMFRVVEETDERNPWRLAPEYQLYDSFNVKVRGDRCAGALYGLIAAAKDLARKPGEWNQVRILLEPAGHNKDRLRFWLNDKQTVDIIIDPAPDSKWFSLLESKKSEGHFAEDFFRARTGPILLQDHGARVAFRNIRILELNSTAAQSNPKPRVIIETDVGIGDGDDDASFVRFLLYADVLDIEGIIATKRDNLNKRYKSFDSGYDFMQVFLDAYEEIQPNLIKHSPGYPTADYLRKRMVRSWTEDGVDLIIAAVDREDLRPVWYCNWGTSNSLGPALDKVRSTRSETEYKEFISRLRVSSLWNKGTVPNHFRNFTSTYVDIGNFEPGKVKRDPYWWSWDDCTVVAWAEKNLKEFNYTKDRHYPWFIVKDHGPLCKLYYHAKEGDTPATSFLFPVGLNHATDPNPGWGSWAGRASPCDEAKYYPVPVERGNFWWYKKEKDANHDNYQGSINRDNTLKRWGLHIQNDFMARCDWCVKSYAEANHPPKVVLNGDRSLNVLEITAKAGDKITLDATGSSDPDGDKLIYQWVYYPEPGTYGKRHDLNGVKFQDDKATKTTIRVPDDAKKGETVHILAIVTDNGKPPLTRYRRVIVELANK